MKRILTVGAALALFLLVASQLIAFAHTSMPTVRPPRLTSFPGNPYGITIDDKNGAFTDTASADFASVNVSVARIQLLWSDIETQQNPFKYDWSSVDTAIQNASNHGLLADLAIQHAPSWDQSSQTCKDQSGGQTGDTLPNAADENRFATQLVTRYNTTGGGGYQFGHIAFIEAGNEEWSFSKCQYDPTVYEPVLKAVYTAVKGIDSSVYVGMFGYTHYTTTSQITSYFTTLFKDAGSYMDYANFHFYRDDQPPDGNYVAKPKYIDVVNKIEAAAQATGHSNKPIWCTEVGWSINHNYGRKYAVTQQQQSDYLQQVLDDSRNSTNVAKVLIYTMDDGCNGMSLTQEVYNNGKCAPPISYTIAYSMLKNYIKQHPTWH